MKVFLKPALPEGRIAAIPSKSDVHRKIICAALSPCSTEIGPVLFSQDVRATVAAVEALGARVRVAADRLELSPGRAEGVPQINCFESGSTLRFLLPVAAALYDKARFTGSGRLPERPLDELIDAMSSHGVCFSRRSLPLETRGRLTSGSFELSGSVSSQYITGLLLALPCLEGDSEIIITSPLQSAPYVDITLKCLSLFGISVEKSSGGYLIHGNRKFCSPQRLETEGDWSNSAFFLCAGALFGRVTVTGLSMTSPQGDKAVAQILSRFGARVTAEGDEVTAERSSLRGCDIDVRDIPDLLPVLAVVAAFAKGKTRFYGAERLRLKESDRLLSVSQMLSSLGGQAEITRDGLEIQGNEALRGGAVNACNDHRIAMSAAIAAMGCREGVEIAGAEAVNKSYPSFFEDYEKLGGKRDVIRIR